MPAFPQPRELLSDGVVTVRLAAERDIPEVLIAYQDDPELHLLMGNERPPTGAELGRRAERAEHDRATGTALSFTVVEPGEDTCIGQIDVHRVDWDNGRAELGVWIAPAARGRGLGRSALFLVGRWLLLEAGLERVELVTRSDNQPMLRAGRAAGYQFEGVLRGYYPALRGVAPGPYLRDGRFDMAVLSLVRRDLETL